MNSLPGSLFLVGGAFPKDVVLFKGQLWQQSFYHVIIIFVLIGGSIVSFLKL